MKCYKARQRKRAECAEPNPRGHINACNGRYSDLLPGSKHLPKPCSVTFVYAAKGNSQQPDCTGFSPVSLLNAILGVPVAGAKVRKNMRISCQLQSN